MLEAVRTYKEHCPSCESSMLCHMQSRSAAYVTETVVFEGEAGVRQVDVRVICATNRNPMLLIAEKKFREESAIIRQTFVKDPGKTVEQHLDGGGITGGECRGRVDQDAVRQHAAAPEPVEVLIGRAGAAVARAALQLLGGTYGRRVVVLAGPGNNGNDGRDAAIRLRRRGVHVEVLETSDLPSVVPPCDLVLDAGKRDEKQRGRVKEFFLSIAPALKDVRETLAAAMLLAGLAPDPGAFDRDPAAARRHGRQLVRRTGRLGLDRQQEA